MRLCFILILLIIACQSRNTNNYETRTLDYKPKTTNELGIQSNLVEDQAGYFLITDESLVSADSCRAIVHYANGHVETLYPEHIKALIYNAIDNNSISQEGTHNLPSALLYSGVGFVVVEVMGNTYLKGFRNTQLVKKVVSNDTVTWRKFNQKYIRNFYDTPEHYYLGQVVIEQIKLTQRTSKN